MAFMHLGLLDKCSKLIDFPTVSGHFNPTENCLNHISDYLTPLGIKTKIYKSGGFASLVAVTQSTKTPKVLLQAHIDVVPAKPEGFKLTERDGKLYGRGVFDMKFAAACYLQLVEDLKDELDQYDFGLIFTSDEEVGGENGVKMLLEQGYGGGVCVLPDSGDNWCIQSSCNGVWIISLTAHGQSAHGSRPWEGDNAIDRLTTGLQAIKAVFGEQKPSKSSLTISQISGGAAMNQVPDEAAATLDMRLATAEDFTIKQAMIEQIAAEHDLELQTLATVNSCSTDLKHPYIKSFMAIAEQVCGRKLRSTHSLGASDAHEFINFDPSKFEQVDPLPAPTELG